MTKYLILIIALASTLGFARTYSTTFPATENPICQAGTWINGGNGGGGACSGIGLDWSNMATQAGFAYNVSGTGFSDGTAVVSGTWGANQYVTGIARCKTPLSEAFPEVELRLRTTITAHNINGYEFDLKCYRGIDSSSYGAIIRWNGPHNNFLQLGSACSGITCGVADGDTVIVTAVGCVLSLYVNGTLQNQQTDCTYPGGAPGMGGDLSSSGGNTNIGWSSFIASDQASVPNTPTNLTGVVH